MNKNAKFIIAAVLSFFAGAIWVSEVPVVATLVAALELGIGFALGYYYDKNNGVKIA